MRNDDEKQALSLHRYKNWVDAIMAKDQEVVRLQAQLNSCMEQLIYAYLEAREEQEHLIQLGLSREQIEAVGIIPAVPFDPLVLFRKAGVTES